MASKGIAKSSKKSEAVSKKAGKVAESKKKSKTVTLAKTIKKSPKAKPKEEDDPKIRKALYDLVIVESPTKAKTIKKYLGRGHEVIASNGHIKDLPKSKLGVDVENNFATDMQMISGKKNVLDKLHKCIAMAKNIYLATDPDREGEAIAYHIAEEIPHKKRSTVYRVLFNAITKSSVKESLQNPAGLNQNKYDSQKARRILDRLVGYKISPILWEKVQRGLSAGRVQSVALRLIVEREEEIKKFVPEQWFSIEALLSKNDKNFKAKYYGEVLGKKLDIIEQAHATKILKDIKNQQFVAHDIKKRERKSGPTPPFTTSKLQQEAANKLGFSSKKTMMLAQKLYEGVEISGAGQTGLITYMRTDSVRTSPEAIESVRSYIEKKYGKDFVASEPIIYKKKGGAKVQDAHEAIRPADLELTPDKVRADLESDQFKLYELIWNKFISSQMKDSIIDQTSVMFKVANHFFKATGSIIKFPGFRTVYLEAQLEKLATKRGESEGDEENENDSFGKELPLLSIGDKLKPIKIPEIIEHWTSPPPRYSDASVVKDLEEKGIGRPSTYATIISNIGDRGYIEKIEGRYQPTELGKVICKMLIKSFPKIMDIEFTAKIEDSLDDVEAGTVKYTKLLKDFWIPFEKNLKVAKEEMKNLKKTEIPTGLKCIKCESGEYMIKWGRNGQFLACSRYPDCTSTEDFKKNFDETYEIIPKKYTETPCPTCSKRLVVKKGRYGRFLACEEYPHCKTTLPYALDVNCPKCKTGKFVEKQSRYGKLFYGCSNYPSCDNAMWTMPKAIACPHCEHPVMSIKESKKSGVHLQCPVCKKVAPVPEEKSNV